MENRRLEIAEKSSSHKREALTAELWQIPPPPFPHKVHQGTPECAVPLSPLVVPAFVRLPLPPCRQKALHQ
jgi:hypothetical protein